MRKAVAVLFVVMIEVATNMPVIRAFTPSESGYGAKWAFTPPESGPGAKCPLNALKLGACVDLLKGLVHVGAGDPVVNKCCPVVEGVAALEAALCLCTTIKVKVLNLNILLPLALELLVSCGLTPPPGFTCPSN